MKGKTITFEVELNDSFYYLKLLIEKSEAIKTENQRLTFEDR